MEQVLTYIRKCEQRVDPQDCCVEVNIKQKNWYEPHMGGMRDQVW